MEAKDRVLMVQLPEPCDENSAAYKAGFEDIAAIGQERVRRVIARVRDEADLASPAPDDLGFKSFLLTPSNFKPWRGDGIETGEQLAEQMQMFVKSEKDGADTEAMLYELLLKFGQELTTAIEVLEYPLTPDHSVAGGEGSKTRVFAIHDRKMLFVLDGFEESMIDPILAIKPPEIIALDSVFADSDELKTNLDLQCRDAGIKFTCV